MTFHLNSIFNWIFHGRHHASLKAIPTRRQDLSPFPSDFTIFTPLKNPLYQPATFCQTIWCSSFLTVPFVGSAPSLLPSQQCTKGQNREAVSSWVNATEYNDIIALVYKIENDKIEVIARTSIKQNKRSRPLTQILVYPTNPSSPWDFFF